MTHQKKDNIITRRGILPLFGASLLLPFLGFGKNKTEQLTENNEEEYQTLLKPDGTAVKVKVNTIQKSKIVKKSISNQSLLQWLGRKL